MDSFTAGRFEGQLVSSFLVVTFATTGALMPMIGRDFGSGRNIGAGYYKSLAEWQLVGYDEGSNGVLSGFIVDRPKGNDIARIVFRYPTKRVKVKVKKMTQLSGFTGLTKMVGREAVS